MSTWIQTSRGVGIKLASFWYSWTKIEPTLAQLVLKIFLIKDNRSGAGQTCIVNISFKLFI